MHFAPTCLLLPLLAADPAISDAAARFTISSEPPARVFLDDTKDLGVAPMQLKVFAPGTHTFTFVRRGYFPRTVTVDAAAGKDTDVSVELAPGSFVGLLSVGASGFLGYTSVSLAPAARASGLTDARESGLGVGLSLQPLPFLDVQGELGVWGPMAGGTSTSLAPEPVQTRVVVQYAAASIGLATPLVPIVPPSWTKGGRTLFIAAAARVGVQGAEAKRTPSECQVGCPHEDVPIEAGRFRELSVTLAPGLVRWHTSIGVGVRVAYRKFTAANTSFADTLMISLEARGAFSLRGVD